MVVGTCVKGCVVDSIFMGVLVKGRPQLRRHNMDNPNRLQKDALDFRDA
jgi:hypothetical protein